MIDNSVLGATWRRRGAVALGACAVTLAWFWMFMAMASVIVPGTAGRGFILQQDVLKAYQQSNEPYLLDDANTVMHCVDGRDFDGTALRCGTTAVRHRSVGPFTTTSYLTTLTNGSGGDWPSRLTNTVHMGCFIFQPTTAGAGLLMQNSDLAAVGYRVKVNVGQTLSLDVFTSDGATTVTTANTAAINQQHVVCEGYDGATAYIQLDGGAVASGVVAGTPGTYTGSGLIGYDGVGFTAAYPGTIAEIWVRSTAWDAALAATIASTVQAMTGPSPALPGLAGHNGLAAQATTVAHCVGDDYNTGGVGVGVWNCTSNRNPHTAVGSFSDAANAPSGYLSRTTTGTTEFPAQGWTACVVIDRPGASESTFIVVEASDGTDGWQLRDDAGDYTCSFLSGGVQQNIIVGFTIRFGATNLVCCGFDGNSGYAGWNEQAVSDAAAAFTPINAVRLGASGVSAGNNYYGTVRELMFSMTPWNSTTFQTAYTAMHTRTTSASALSAWAASDANVTLHTVFDDWTRTGIASRIRTIGSEWSVTGSIGHTETADRWAQTTLSWTGAAPAPVDAPFNWPAIAWTEQGAVPQSTSSASFPTGFGPVRRQLGGFSDANNATLSTASDVLDLTTLTGCIVFYQDSVAAAETIYGNGTANVAGMYLTHGAGSTTMSFNMAGAAVTYTINGTITANADNVVCFGRGTDNNLRLAVNDGAAVAAVAAAAPVAGTAQQAYLGRATGAGTGAANTRLKEFWVSSTAATDVVVTQQARATLRCNTPGACIPEDSGTLMHCTVDTDWSISGTTGLRCSKNLGNQPWTTNGAPTITSAQYAWAYGTTGVDREGMGNFSDANYFTGTVGGPLQFTAAGWEVCAVFNPMSTANQPVLIADVNGAVTAGWYMQLTAAGVLRCLTANAGGFSTADTVNAVVLNGLNIGCCAHDGANVKAKLNGGATGTAARSFVVPATATPYLGRYSGASFAFAGKIYEVWASNTVWTEADIAAREARFMNLYAGSFGEVETLTRASASSTTDPDGNISYVPAGMPVVEKAGLLSFLARTNVALYAEQFNQAATWVPTNLVCAADTTAAPDGQTTAETCTDNANNTAHEILQAYVATAAAWTVSVYAKAGTLGFVHLSPDNANFTWFNLATCTAGTNAAGNTAAVYTSIPGWCRVGVTRTMGAGAANASIGVSAADATRVYVGAGGTAILWGGQIEAGAYMGPYIPTTNVAVQRNADAATMVNQLTGNTDFCVELDATPFGARAWSAGDTYLIGAGIGAVPNSFQLRSFTNGRIYFSVFDAAGGMKRVSTVHGFAAGSTHKLKACSLGGILQQWFDGVLQVNINEVLGTGIITTMPPAIGIGNPGSGPQFDGYVKNVVVDPPLLPSSEVTLHQPFNLNDPIDLTQAGVVAPSLDCQGSQYVGGANWPCTGGTGTKSGAPTSGNATPYYPAGFGGTRETSAFFNSATPDYFSFGDVYDVTGSFGGLAVFRTDTTAAGVAYLMAKRGGAGTQWALYRNGASLILEIRKASGAASTLTLGTLVANEWNAAAWSYVYTADGSSTLRGNLNGVAPAENNTAVGPPVDYATNFTIGRDDAGGGGWSGYIARAGHWQTTGFTAAQLARIVSLLQTGIASPVTNTRTGVATITPVVTAAIPSMFNSSAKTPRMGTAGVLSEEARINYAWPSEDLSHANWVKSAGIALVANQGTFPDGNVTMDQITSTLNTDTATMTTTSASSTTFVASAWARSTAGSLVESVVGACPGGNNVTACTCNTNTGLACTPASLNNECWAYATFTTAPVRIWANFTCTAATTAPTIGVHDGQYRTTGAVGGMFGGMQLEVGLYPTSYIPTSTGTVPRNADVIVQTNILRDSQTRWCVRGTFTPENGRAWGADGAGTYHTLWGIGTQDAANSADLYEIGANIQFFVWDAAGTVRWLSWAHGYAAGSTHSLVACSSGGVLKLYSDGVDVGGALFGAGTGIISTMPATFRLLHNYRFNGWGQYIDQCPNADPTRCW